MKACQTKSTEQLHNKSPSLWSLELHRTSYTTKAAVSLAHKQQEGNTTQQMQANIMLGIQPKNLSQQVEGIMHHTRHIKL